MARTGLRLGEVLLLQPSDFDFEGRRILIRRTWGRCGDTEDERFHQAPKGGPAWVDASDQVCAIVQKLLTLRQAAALVDGVAPSEWLFPRKCSRPGPGGLAATGGRYDRPHACPRAPSGPGRPPAGTSGDLPGLAPAPDTGAAPPPAGREPP
jgi:integrase